VVAPLVLALLTHVQDEVLLLKPLHIGLVVDRHLYYLSIWLLAAVMLAVAVV
jgi:hypothetical protein